MIEKRSLQRDLVALGLLALAVFLGASLLSYHPADPPNRLIYPAHVEPVNLCGRSGAAASWLLLHAFGYGAYYLLASLAVLDAVLLARRDVAVPLVRLAGWLLSLWGFCSLVAIALPAYSPGPLIGPGGYLGAAGRGLLERYFAATGSYILVLSTLVGGLLLCTDYVLVKLLAWTIGVPAANFGRGAVRVGMAYAEKVRLRRRTDLDPPVAKGDLSSAKVRIGGRAADAAAAEDASANDEGKPSDASANKKPPAAAAGDSDAAAAGESAPVPIRKPRKGRREEILEQIESNAAPAAPKQSVDYELPSIDLLLASEPFRFEEQEKEVRLRAKILEKTFADFGFNIRVVEIQTGPVIAQYEVELEAGLRLSKITGLADDLAIALRVPSVRIVAPIPGKNTVGVEVPNTERQLVRMREVMEEAWARAGAMRIPIFLGKDVAGNPMIVDLASLPHLLIAGRTGTGKSVCLNSVIVSLLMTRRPDEVRTLLIDPKMVELSPYKSIPHLMHPVVTDMRKAEAILAWAVEKMEERYQLLARAGVRHISVYNQLGEEELMERMNPIDDVERQSIPTQIPYIVIVADEMADLMMTSAKEVEQHIIRLAQKSRAVGIHLVLATQKPTVDVITGLIKSNLPARICFQVASRVDSRVVLDEMGADKLLGNGDMLFLWPGTSTLLRGQGTYVSDDEINKVIDAVSTTEPEFVKELVQLKTTDPAAEDEGFQSRDDLYDAAVDVIVREGRGSCSLLQRALGIGYGRAARLIDFMAEDGLVGAYNGSQARDVLVSVEQWDQMKARRQGKSTAAPAMLAESGASTARPASRIVLRGDAESTPTKPPRRAPPKPSAEPEAPDEAEAHADEEDFEEADNESDDDSEEDAAAKSDSKDGEDFDAEDIAADADAERETDDASMSAPWEDEEDEEENGDSDDDSRDDFEDDEFDEDGIDDHSADEPEDEPEDADAGGEPDELIPIVRPRTGKPRRGTRKTSARHDR